METLKGKVAIVTGSSDGIGTEIALEFVRLGALVTLHGRNADKLEAVAQKCQKLSKDKKKPLVVVGDICKDEVRKKLIDETVRHYGKLDIVVSNAGYAFSKPIVENCDLKVLDDMLAVHTRAPLHLLKLSAQHLIKSKGNFINVSSIAGSHVLMPGIVEYSTAKAAADHMMRFGALELGPKGVRVNTISPGLIHTNIMNNSNVATNQPLLTDEQIKGFQSGFAKLIPAQRGGEVQEVAQLAAFLASGKASYITGGNHVVDGGLLNCGTSSASSQP